MVFDQAGGEELALILKRWRIANQLLELSTDLDNASESQHRNVCDGNHPSYRFHLKEILARQVQKRLFQDFDGKLGQS